MFQFSKRLVWHGVFLLIASFFSLALTQTLTVLTHDSFAIAEAVIEEFTQETGIAVEFISGGDAGETVNRAILTQRNPLADLLFGVDNSLIARANAADIFEPYQSPALVNVNPRYLFDEANTVTPIDAGYVSFNLDKAYFETQTLDLPKDISELSQETYKGLVLVQNPTSSSPGLAFMLATIAKFGTEGENSWLHYWAALRDNDVTITSGWTEAYYTDFSLYGGTKPIVLSYASSPAAEVMFAENPLEDAPTANLFCENCVFEQIEAVGILKNSNNQEAAKQFIDFMLSERFQADIAPNMFVYPSVTGISLPSEFESYSQIPNESQTATLEPAFIEANLKTWLSQWTAVVEQGRNPEDVN